MRKIYPCFITIVWPGLTMANSQFNSYAGNQYTSILKMILALGGVIAFIFFSAWIMKRLVLNQRGLNGLFKVRSTFPLGTREKLILIDVGKSRLLLGVTSQNINTLHVFKKDEISEIELSAGKQKGSKFMDVLHGESQ